ncbi:hypothetical protein F0562_003565 [Nyssa sinensis]|uniref:Uncharacterized protein n=1 Tax=Nyssa sinensis TaxID=561372 RepID=A0A5J5BX22_9ASTE|nr:hypothetical protein F0562_003565 [Nyssa sinensis]
MQLEEDDNDEEIHADVDNDKDEQNSVDQLLIPPCADTVGLLENNLSLNYISEEGEALSSQGCREDDNAYMETDNSLIGPSLFGPIGDNNSPNSCNAAQNPF